MRLLNVDSPELELEEFFGNNIPPYAILSHTWERGEVLFQDLKRHHYKHKLGYEKIRFTCEQARKDGLNWCWVDTCCIDKSSSAELSEAINSMFNWYKRAKVCYAYLSDVNLNETNIISGETLPRINQDVAGVEMADLQHDYSCAFTLEVEPKGPVLEAVKDSRWLGRGWTLQELIAPRVLQFYDLNWHCLGDRDNELLDVVYERTGLSLAILGKPENLQDVPIAQRMSWMADRQTTRKEDEAYCMLGIFGVNMPLLYGEEGMAFARLQEELIRRFRDHSLLIFTDQTPEGSRKQLVLATSPRDFLRCNDVQASDLFQNLFPLQSFNVTNDGLHISLPLIRSERSGLSVDLALLGYAHKGLPIGLILVREPPHSDNNERCVLNARLNLPEDGVRNRPQLGTGTIYIKEEVAVTAERETILIREKVSFDTIRHNDFSPDIWLRYDSALWFVTKSPGYISRIVARHDRLPPHMIWLKGLRKPPTPTREIAVLKFSLESIRPSVVVVALAYHTWLDTRGVLAITENHQVQTQEQLSVFGARLLDDGKEAHDPHTLENGGPIVSLWIEGIGMLELWHDGAIGDCNRGRGRMTLRIESSTNDVSDKRRLSDGTQY